MKDEKNIGRMRKNLENNFVIIDGLNIKERIMKQSDIPIRFNYGNYYITANNVWNTIHNPITYDILCGKSKMPTETVEGAELVFEIGSNIKNDFNIKKMPLLIGMVEAILNDKKFEINWENFH